MNATRYEHRDGTMNNNSGAGSQPNNNGASDQVNWSGQDGAATFNLDSFANHSSSYGNVVVSGQAHLGNQYTFYSHANPAIQVPIVVNPKEQLMDLLRIDETFLRYAQVDKPFGDSFSWLFENESLGFSRWLEDDTSLYWIRGKPASGKSTLMKMAYGHPETQATLKESSCRRAGAAFFFHDRGSLYQKSFVGLLCSILYQVLNALPELIEHVLPAFGSTLTTLTTRRLHQDITLSFAELQAAFELVSTQTVYSVHILLFLDALDEYSGKHEDIAKFLVPTNQNMFFEPTFEHFLDYFPEVPGFFMQDHTIADMKIVVDTILRGNQRMEQRFDSEDSRVNGPVLLLRQQILERADGVFLWVRLVLDQLLEAFCDGADVTELSTILEDIPNDLNLFYVRILDRIPQKYKEETLIMLDIVRCVPEPLNAAAFYDSFHNAQSEELATFEFGNMGDDSLVDRLERLLRSRTGGLLELAKNVKGWKTENLLGVTAESVDAYQVQFTHQTVKTFVQQPNTRLRLHHRRASSTTGFEYYLRAHFAAAERVYRTSDKKMKTQLKHILGYELRYCQLPLEFSQHLLAYLTYTGTTTENPLTAILRLATDDAVVAAYHTRLWTEEQGFPAISTVTELTAVAGLHLYMKEHLMNRRLLTIEADRLLCLVIRYFMDYLTYDRPVAEILCYSLLMNSILQALTHEKSRMRLEAFQRLWVDNAGRLRELGEHGRLFDEIIELFLRHGQDINVPISYMHVVTIQSTDNREDTALHLAVRHQRLEWVDLFLRYDAIVNAFNSAKETTLDVAYMQILLYWTEDSRWITLRVIGKLLDAGGSVTSKQGRISVTRHLERLSQLFQQDEELSGATDDHFIERILHPPVLVLTTKKLSESSIMVEIEKPALREEKSEAGRVDKTREADRPSRVNTLRQSVAWIKTKALEKPQGRKA